MPDQRTYAELVASGAVVLGDGATGTRLRLETPLVLDQALDIGGLAIDGRGAALQAVAAEYVGIARSLQLPITIDTATYWASPDHVARRPGADLATVNRACAEAIAPLREPGKVFLAGLVGPRADAYRPSRAAVGGKPGVESVGAATEFHAPQVEALANAGVDVLLAATMSTTIEARGLAQAMAATALDYVVATVLDSTGHIPDGTPLEKFVAAIDAAEHRPPAHYLLHCTHPTTALAGMRAVAARGHDLRGRVVGIKANGSALPLDQLDGATGIHADGPLVWLAGMTQLRDEFAFNVLGGCCGTDGRHLLALALSCSALGGSAG